MPPNPRSCIINWNINDRWRVANADGNGRDSDDNNIAPALGAALAVRF
jgi:hypothetical protein